MAYFTYVQFSIKWFNWMIQLWCENLLFFMFKKSDSVLIQASMPHCANVLGALFYLLRKILHLITTFFLFLTFMIPNFLIFYVLDFPAFSHFIGQLHFRIFQTLCFLISNFGLILAILFPPSSTVSPLLVHI